MSEAAKIASGSTLRAEAPVFVPEANRNIHASVVKGYEAYWAVAAAEEAAAKAAAQAQAASEAPLSVDGACRSSNPIPDLDSEPDPLIGEPNPYPHRGGVAAAASKALPQEAGLDA